MTGRQVFTTRANDDGTYAVLVDEETLIPDCDHEEAENAAKLMNELAEVGWTVSPSDMGRGRRYSGGGMVPPGRHNPDPRVTAKTLGIDVPEGAKDADIWERIWANDSEVQDLTYVPEGEAS